MKRSLSFASVTFALLQVSPALAQDPAAAEALFNKGVAEMQAGHFDVACPAISESQRLDPRPGTLFTLAECEAKSGKIATALVHYDDYIHAADGLPAAQKKRHAERVEIARGQKTALAPKVPTLTLVLPKGAPASLEVSRDGTALSAASLGVALPVDPGEHVVVTSLPGGAKTEQRITIATGDKKSLELQWKPAGSPGPDASGTAAPPATGAPAADSTGPSGRRVGAYVAGGVGVVGLALGGVMGGLALGSKSEVDANCPGLVCNDKGTKALESGRTLGLVSTIGFGVGAAGLATAVILWLTEPAPSKPGAVGVSMDVELDPSGGLVRLKGAF